jgi:hypothetical protein
MEDESASTEASGIRELSLLMRISVPHPFRVFLRNGWDSNEIPVYTISKNTLGL